MAINPRIIIASLLFISAFAQLYEIDLDLPPSERYSEVARIKKQSISSFISYLKQNVRKYTISFKVTAQLLKANPSLVKSKVGHEFYEQCLSIAEGASLPLSDVIVFNYMYELGAATDFCTAITVSGQNMRLLGRNLDYGYQEYLANNSVHLQYRRQGEIIFQTLGHAGLVGTHTALKRGTKLSPYQFAVTMNERVEGGLHKTLAKIITGNCQTSPYALMRALKESSGNVEDMIKYLNDMNTCTAVYWTIQSREGSSYAMEKNRGVGSHKIREAEIEKNINFIVQTNHDFDTPDPDNRSTAARDKIINKINSNSVISQDNIWQILTESPNFNKLTLMTGIIDVQRGNITYRVWN